VNERKGNRWVHAYREQIGSVRKGVLALSIITCLAAVASVTLALSRLSTIVAAGGRFDPSVGWTVVGLKFQWWLVVSLFVRCTGQLIGRLGWWLISLFALLGSFGLFVAWASWSHGVIQVVMGGTALTTRFFLGGNDITDYLLVLVVLNLISELAVLIAAPLAARKSR